ncbi:MAG: tRNA lysidine(34) synthetase TilS [bacterium]
MKKDRIRLVVLKELERLVSQGDNILIGASGGCDSTALVYILYSLKKRFSLSLSLCHFNHCLRKESGKDAEFVKGIAQRLNLALYVERWENPIHSQRMARRARYDFFLKVAKEINAKSIALGHNLDDNIETILFHIIRGESPYGIEEKREMDGIRIIRPLIDIERKEIEKYLAKNNIPFIIDKTNTEPVYTRNKIRLKLIPLLYEFNPRFKYGLLKLSSIWKRNLDFLEEEAEKTISKESHPALLAHILRKKGLSFSKIEKTIKMIKDGKVKI